MGVWVGRWGGVEVSLLSLSCSPSHFSLPLSAPLLQAEQYRQRHGSAGLDTDHVAHLKLLSSRLKPALAALDLVIVTTPPLIHTHTRRGMRTKCAGRLESYPDTRHVRAFIILSACGHVCVHETAARSGARPSRRRGSRWSF